jgi:hypothetical protein
MSADDVVSRLATRADESFRTDSGSDIWRFRSI